MLFNGFYYGACQGIIGFPSASTIHIEQAPERHFLGLNSRSFKKASVEYDGTLVYECSDEARVKR